MKITRYIILILILLCPDLIYATQAHGEPEGIFVHQFAHLFFMFSMLLLIYWLRQRDLIRVPGWKLIQYSAMFFILWNITVVWVHFMDEQAMLVSVETSVSGQFTVVSPLGKWVCFLYYICKMDHIFCVPALVFLFSGLRKLSSDSDKRQGGGS